MTESPNAAEEPPPADAPFDVELLLALPILAIAALAATTLVSLLLYSPTKLNRQAGRDDAAFDDRTDREMLALSGVATVMLLSAATALTWRSAGPITASAIGVLAILFVGTLPLRIAATSAESWVLALSPLLRPAHRLLRRPVLIPLIYVTGTVARLLRVPASGTSDEPEQIADEIVAAVHDSARDAEIREEERAWIENIVELEARAAEDVMTPRTDMIALPESTRLRDAMALARKQGYSRYPVFRDGVDDIIGVFYVKDALAAIHEEPDTEQTAGDIARPAEFVAESIGIVELLRKLRRRRVHLAVVQDEYGGTAGVITIEDLIEEIVGEIEDEHDPNVAQAAVVVSSSAIELAGRTRVDEVDGPIGDRIPEAEDYETVAGWVFTALDRIPRCGEVLTLGGLRIEILEADERRISRVRLALAESGPSA